MIYLLDTNVCVHYLRNADSPIRGRLAALGPTEVAICDVVKAELLYGAYRSARPEFQLALVREFCGPLQSLPFDGEAAEHFGRIRSDLARQGATIGPYDLMIAAIAMANDAMLITHNTREFSRVEGLRLDDWQVGHG